MAELSTYLEVVREYNKNDSKVSNDELAMALTPITQQETLCGIYLDQLTEYALSLLLRTDDNDQCSASIITDLGCRLTKTIIVSYDKAIKNEKDDEIDSNLKMIQEFIDKISPKIKIILNELLEILLASNINDKILPKYQQNLSRIMELIAFFFNDDNFENKNMMDFIILNSNDLRSMVLSLSLNIICKYDEIEAKVRNESITITFFKLLTDISNNMICKYFKIHELIKNKNINKNISEIINDSINLIKPLLNHFRNSFNPQIFHHILNFTKQILRTPNILTFDKIIKIFDIIYEEGTFYENKYLEMVNDNDLNGIKTCFMMTKFFLNFLSPFAIIWSNKINEIKDYDQNKAIMIQTFMMKKMMKYFQQILKFPTENNKLECLPKDTASIIDTKHKNSSKFVNGYFKQILKCNIDSNNNNKMQIEILKWFKIQIDGNIDNNLWNIWFEYIEKINIDDFDEIKEIIQCLDISHTFLQIILNQLFKNKEMYFKCRLSIFSFCAKAFIYFLDDDDGAQKKPYHDLMVFLFDKALSNYDDDDDELNQFWIKVIISVLLSLPIKFNELNINIILKALQFDVNKANNGDLNSYDKCKLLMSILMGIYIKYFVSNNDDNLQFSNYIWNSFQKICDDKFTLFLIWCQQYPWNYNIIKQKDVNMIKTIIKTIGGPLKDVKNGTCITFQNGFNIFAILLKNRPMICQNIMDKISKLITISIENKMFFSSKYLENDYDYDNNKLCINLESYLSILRVYSQSIYSLDMEIKTKFVRYTVELLYLYPSMLEMDICKYLLPNIRWKLSEINNNDKNFAIQVHCIGLLYHKCLSSNNNKVIQETIKAMQISQQYLPFNITVLIPNKCRDKICSIIS